MQLFFFSHLVNIGRGNLINDLHAGFQNAYYSFESLAMKSCTKQKCRLCLTVVQQLGDC